MTDMDRFTEQNDLKTTKLQKLWRSPEQRYRYLEDFFAKPERLDLAKS